MIMIVNFHWAKALWALCQRPCIFNTLHFEEAAIT